MQCLQCGADQAKENLFCTKCGARMSASQSLLSPAEASKGEALPPSTADEEEEEILRELKEALKSVEPSKDPKPNAETAPQTSNKKLWITGLATTLVAFVAIGLLLFLKSKKEPAASPPASIVELPAQPPTAILTGPDEPTRVTVGKMGAVIEAITQYSKTKKGLPSSLTNISRAYADPESIKDGWGQNILYLVDLTNKTYVLRSLGSDGRRDTGDDIAVYSDNVEGWLTEQEAIINEWKLANPNSYSQLTLAGPSPEELKKLEAAQKKRGGKKETAGGSWRSEAKEGDGTKAT